MDFKLAVYQLGRSLDRNSPTILTAFGVTGLVTTVVMAVAATPRALRLISEEEDYRPRIDIKGQFDIPLTNKEIIELVWKCYIPAGLVGLATIVCIIGANSVSLRRNAALASLYSLTEATLREYQAKVIETIGEKKEEKVRDAIAKDTLDRNPVGERTVIMTGKGEYLFLDTLSGHYFRNDIESVRKAVNNFNEELLQQLFIPINEFWYEIGLVQTEFGRQMGYATDHGFLIVEYSTQIADNGEPCIVMKYPVQPKHLTN